MAYQCAHCGKTHNDLPRFFSYHAPTNRDGDFIPVIHERKSMCRTDDSQFFVRCEVEVPLADIGVPPLGFVCWVSVGKVDYERLLRYRENEETEDPYSELMPGTLANTLSSLTYSLGIPVKFKVLKGDATPYVRWIQPDSSLAKLIACGASSDLWHKIALTKSND